MKTAAPLVSVVLCTYNDEKYIGRTIDSILAQTFSDYEFIIWNDGSTDGTEDIIKSYNDKRIRYFRHDNTGLGEALHLACNEAKGTYIARIDGDDISFPYRFEVEVDYLNKHKDYVLVSSSVEFIDENDVVLGRNFLCTNSKIIKKTLAISSMIVHPMTMFRRDAYFRAGGYLKIKQFEDRIFWSRLAKQGKFKNLPTTLGQYRILGSSISHNINPYGEILYELRTKMIKDDEILQSDIELYNKICVHSKKFIINNPDASSRRKKTIEEKLYNCCSRFLGKNMAETLVYYIKNIICRIKYR